MITEILLQNNPLHAHLNNRSETGVPEIFSPLPFAYINAKECQKHVWLLSYMCARFLVNVCMHFWT